MVKDPIVEEVRKARAAFAKRHGNDINAMCDALGRRKDSTASYVSFAPKLVVKHAPRRTRSSRIAEAA